MSGSQWPYLYTRIRGLYQARGLVGTVRFLASRIVRMAADQCFEADLSAEPPSATFPTDVQVRLIDRRTVGDPNVALWLQAATQGESQVYLEGLAKDDLLYCIVDRNGEVIHYSFVQFVSRYKTILDEDIATPLFTNCWTSPNARGKRVYPNTLLTACGELRRRGHRRVVITCDPDNTASTKGILHAGFRPTRRISSLIFLSRLALQRIVRDPAERARWRLCRL